MTKDLPVIIQLLMKTIGGTNVFTHGMGVKTAYR